MKITLRVAVAVSGLVMPVFCAAQEQALPQGKAMVWQDRGELTPAKVFWGAASRCANPASRLPQPPFSNFVKDSTPNAFSPKCKVTDRNGVEWTVKFGKEVHADIAAPRLAWALGFGVDECYYVESGKIDGVSAQTDLGKVRGIVKPDGSFENARFKRHNKDAKHVCQGKGNDLNWSEAENPGVPPEHLSGLMMLDVLVCNWDAQPKNCKIIHTEGANGPENWYIMSDWGASFALRPPAKFVLRDYAGEQSFIRAVSADTVQFSFADAIASQAKAHQHIPLAHAQWFRKLLERLTDDEIRAAFDAAFASDAINGSYLAGGPLSTRERQVSSQEVSGFVAKFREKIEEFKAKIPAGT